MTAPPSTRWARPKTGSSSSTRARRPSTCRRSPSATAGRSQPLPAEVLAPGDRALFWADGEVGDGPRHLPFRISSGGDTVVLRDSAGAVDRPGGRPGAGGESGLRPLPRWRRRVCAVRVRLAGAGERRPVWATAASRVARRRCEFAPYTWPDAPPGPAGPVAITEVALFPARFIEVQNISPAAVDLADLVLFLQPLGPGESLPDWFGTTALSALAWPADAASLARRGAPVGAGRGGARGRHRHEPGARGHRDLAAKKRSGGAGSRPLHALARRRGAGPRRRRGRPPGTTVSLRQRRHAGPCHRGRPSSGAPGGRPRSSTGHRR